jgi:hypothetical protein
MMNFLKHWLKRINWLLILIFALAALVRFYNFPNRVTFWSEQARSLIVSANYIKEKPSLLGQEYFRQDSNAHIIYSGAIFNYSLIPLLSISNYNPIPITAFFTILNLFTGLVIYWVVKKIFDRKLALISAVLFIFNDFMIYHSLFIWNYNYLPLIGILTFYFSYEFISRRKKLDIFLIGILCGVGISFQILFLPIALIAFILNIWKSKEKIVGTLLFVMGLIIGNLPMFVFDVRHNFYQVRTLLQYLLDTFQGKSDAAFAYYYLLPFWPLFAVAGGFIIFWTWKRSRLLAGLVVILYLFLNLTSNRIDWKAPTGMPRGITTRNIEKASKMIAADAKGDFNIAEVLDFDKQAYVLRYYLQFKDNKIPQGVTDYPNAKVLYVLSQISYNFNKSDVWEVKSGGPYKVSLLSEVGQGYAIYKLQK